MNKQVVRLTESQLHQLIEESVYRVLYENEEDESWVGDKLNQGKQAVKSFFGNGYGKDAVYKKGTTDDEGNDISGNLKNYRNSTRNRQERGDWTANRLNGTTPLNLGKRFKALKAGWTEQGNVNNANNVMEMLNNLVNDGVINPNMTVKEVLNKMMGNRLSAQKRVSNANNDIYSGMMPGVMGTGRKNTVR